MRRKNPYRVKFEVHGIKYEVDWYNFIKGTSLFVPCLSPSIARTALLREAKLRGYDIVALLRVENGVKGVRAWRVG